MTKLSEKVVWITGGSSGIGEGIVKHLANRNIKMIISSRREEALKKVVDECPESARENIKILTLDLGQPNSLAAKAKEAEDFFGRVDVIIHSGGISQRSKVLDTDIDVDRRLMEIDFFSTVILTKALLPGMISRGSGHIVPISSLTGKFGSPWRSGYAAAKHALHGFYDSLRAEHHDDKIKVTMVAPGFVRTNVSVNALDSSGNKLNEMDAAQENGMSPEKCASLIVSAIERNKLEIVIGGKEILGVFIKRFFPNWFASIIRKAKVR